MNFTEQEKRQGFQVTEYGVRRSIANRTVTDKKGQSWRFYGYNPKTNQVIFTSYQLNVIQDSLLEVNVDSQSLIEQFHTINLLNMFGWQGGTIWQVIDALRLGEKPRSCV